VRPHPLSPHTRRPRQREAEEGDAERQADLEQELAVLQDQLAQREAAQLDFGTQEAVWRDRLEELENCLHTAVDRAENAEAREVKDQFFFPWE